MIHHSDWTFHGFAKVFDGHVREQLPWYELASAAMGLIARQYIPKGGKVYDWELPRAMWGVCLHLRLRRAVRD